MSFRILPLDLPGVQFSTRRLKKAPPMTEPERLAMAIPALAGAALYGLYNLATLLGAGHQPTGQDVIKAAFNMGCALVVGVLVAWFAGPEMLRLVPGAKALGPSPMGLIIGAFAWEVLPLAFRLGRQWLQKRAEERLGAGAAGKEGGQ